ncbi:MAG: hypothetical protein WCA04_11895 [Geobacteraceae bacterium]
MESHVTPACTNQLKKVAYALDKLCPISPKNLSEGLHVCRTLQMHGIPSTLGKFSKPGDDTAEIINEYMLASTAIKSSSAANHFYLSVKPGVLDFDSDKVLEIATAALQQGHGVHFDSREHEQAEPTIRLLQEIIDLNIPADDTTCNWKFSIAMPSRWKRSIVDAQWAIDKGVRVRLVKGEFKPADSADAMDPEKGFLELVDRLAGNVPEIALASHDYALVREALVRCKKCSTPVQLELIFGLPVGKMTALAVEMGVPVRFYIPYGDALLRYGIKYFLQNPRKLLRPGLPELFAGFKSKLDRAVLVT